MKPGDIVWVPFPHVEDNQLQSRPALVIAIGLAGRLNLCWASMITAAANPAWPETRASHQKGSQGSLL